VTFRLQTQSLDASTLMIFYLKSEFIYLLMHMVFYLKKLNSLFCIFKMHIYSIIFMFIYKPWS